MAPPFKQHLPGYNPDGNMLDKYGIPMPGEQWPKWSDDPPARGKKHGCARKRRDMFDKETDDSWLLRLMRKIALFRNDRRPSMQKALLDVVKLVLMSLLFILYVIFAVIPAIVLVLLQVAWSAVVSLVTKPTESLKFIGALAIVGSIYLLKIILTIHKIWVILLLTTIVVVGIFFVYYTYIAAPAESYAVNLGLNGLNGKAMQITNNRSASDVTYGQLLLFLAQDDTDKTLGDYQTMRVEASVRLHDNAERAGIRAGVAEVSLSNAFSPTYCWNAFNTTDQGMVYVSAYHPIKNQDDDSLIYIPDSGAVQGQIFFVPAKTAGSTSYRSLTAAMGRTAVSGTVTGINVVW